MLFQTDSKRVAATPMMISRRTVGTWRAYPAQRKSLHYRDHRLLELRSRPPRRCQSWNNPIRYHKKTLIIKRPLNMIITSYNKIKNKQRLKYQIKLISRSTPARPDRSQRTWKTWTSTTLLRSSLLSRATWETNTEPIRLLCPFDVEQRWPSVNCIDQPYLSSNTHTRIEINIK